MARVTLCLTCGRRARGTWGGIALCAECGAAANELLQSGAGNARKAALLLLTEDRLQELEWLGVDGGIREELREVREGTGLTAGEAHLLAGMAFVGAEVARMGREVRERLDAAKENARRENAARAAALKEKELTAEQAAAKEARRRELRAALGR